MRVVLLNLKSYGDMGGGHVIIQANNKLAGVFSGLPTYLSNRPEAQKDASVHRDGVVPTASLTGSALFLQ